MIQERNKNIVNPFAFTTKLHEVEAKSPEFILTDFLPIAKRKVTMLSAKGGEGKSFIAIQAGLRLANSGENVGMWLSEDEVGEIKERADLINQRILFNNSEIPSNIYINGSEHYPPFVSIDNFEMMLEAWKGFELVVIDPLIGFFAGNENDNGEAKRFMSILTSIAVQNNQSILILHHNSKAKDDEGNTSVRGASAFIDACRIQYSLRYDKESKKHLIKLEKDNVNAKKFKGVEFNITAIPFDVVYEDVEPTKPELKGKGVNSDF